MPGSTLLLQALGQAFAGALRAPSTACLTLLICLFRLRTLTASPVPSLGSETN